MRKTIKGAIFCSIIFSFLFAGTLIFAETEKTDEEIYAEIEALYKRVQELTQKVKDATEGTPAEVEVEEEAKEVSEMVVETEDFYLQSYIKYGANNNIEEVKKLQTFLNENEGESIPVTGFYGNITKEAVNRFQLKYKEDVLTPWGITEPTGYVYKTTQRKINMIKSPELNLPMPVINGREIETEAGTTTKKIEMPTTTPTAEVTEEKGTKIFGEEELSNGEEAEELEETEEEIVKEEEKESRAGTWTIFVLALIGLATSLYYIYTDKAYKKHQN